jgi:WD40 repeat protein
MKPHSAVLSPDRRFLAFADEGTKADGPEQILIWDLESGKLLKKLEGHATRIGMLTFSPDGKQIASIGQHGVAIKIWSTE